MSKAFTREDNPSEDLDGDEREDEREEDEAEQRLKLGSSGKNYVTPPGLARLKSELHELLTVERPKLVETVAWAASNGDRSENADYIYGKRRLREIDRRIRFLQKRLDSASVVDPALQSGDRVLFGATVTIRDEAGAERTYSIVGIDEANARDRKISWISPLAQALLQAREGDAVLFRSPKGEEEIEVVKVEFKAID